MKKRILSALIAVTACLVLLAGCGGKDNPSDMLQAGADNYGEGKEEVEYELPGNTAKKLQELIDSYSAMRKEPEPIKEDEAQVIIDQTDDDDQLDTTGNDTIGSDEDLEKILARMMDETKTTAQYTLVNGYTFDFDIYLKVLERAMRKDSIDGICVGTYGMAGSGNSGTLVLGYDLPVSELVRIKQETRQLVKDALSELNLKGKSDLEIIVAVNDYLCDNNEYPPEDLSKYPGVLEGYSPQSHTAYGLFQEHSAVCEGYARACELLLNEYGVDCINIWGDTPGGGHAWNMVSYDGAWYHMDACWNDGGGDREQFLLVSDDYMEQSRVWDTAEYPVSAKNSYQW
jgi:hypothetical protein